MSARRAGILLHPTSLPGRFGIGDLGPAARRFAGFLAAAGQTLWQVLPLAPTGYGDSPYQGLGAFAGNPLLVSLEDLAADGLLDAADLASAPAFPAGAVDYGPVITWKTALLRRAAERFDAGAAPALRRAFDDFRARAARWLDDFALFAALKDRHGGLPWTRWPASLSRREPVALARAREELAPEVRAIELSQFAFDRQWLALRDHARGRGVGLVGDLPIYVAHDSSDVWARPDLFQLDARGEPAFVAGVPPDYFSATGQLWGNPLYRWEEQAEACHDFMLERLRAALAQVDLVRVDHFRGFEAYWAVPAGAPTSQEGAWRPGPGAALFDHLQRELGPLPLIAENLGVITPEVEALRHRYGLPGMAILSFAFGKDPQAPGFRPHAYARDLVAYTGTHDNDTVVGWWRSEGGDSIRSEADVREEKDLARRYLDLGDRPIHEAMIRALYASVADTAIVPLQDVLGLGSEARMNRPATATGNWRWRFREEDMGAAQAAWLGELCGLYGRA
ncbi:MAG TPA: 4-alpha-glucanotransferase [Anaeromyxobacteraceae bacterium]|jgi:4-alpha-glucanotransferase|nr:4-alpha-glucanotransferase [Anaeromyxobacteraceae bacterium]